MTLRDFGPKPRLLDLFAGCGGLSLGFEEAGFEVVAAVDNWPEALAVHRRNFRHPAIELDLGDVELAKAVLSEWTSGVDGIVGGPPCQDFSSAGRRVEADRADLTEKFAELVVAFMPRFFVMENVGRAAKSAALRRAVGIFESRGYTVDRVVLDASRCGVPQTRKRLFTIGFLDQEGTDRAMRALAEGLAAEPMTLRDYFGSALDFEHYYRHPRSYARRAVFSVDEPSPTVRGVNRPVPSGYPGHPGDTAPVAAELRPLTTAERAMVQTFPADFWFGATKTAAEQMIGNAVPVRLAQYVAEAVREGLMSRENPRTSRLASRSA
ncbi:MAG: DNA cytosine methyltransferase [Segniliparus sp.]|uniref:DNA cytosine methyltransferase n=1 Tax=Segniliparus sp. TaxID=2804064 RepID=UPI003F31109E